MRNDTEQLFSSNQARMRFARDLADEMSDRDERLHSLVSVIIEKLTEDRESSAILALRIAEVADEILCDAAVMLTLKKCLDEALSDLPEKVA